MANTARIIAALLITFEGTVSDTEDPERTLVVVWASETDGPIEGVLNEPDSEGQLLGAAMHPVSVQSPP